MIPTYLKTSFVKTTAITHKDFYQLICKIVGILMKLIELNTVKKIISLEKAYAVKKDTRSVKIKVFNGDIFVRI